MAHVVFRNMINVIENKLLSVSNNIEEYKEHFNSWHPKKHREKAEVFSRETKLTLRIVFWLIVSRLVQSIPVALDSFFSALDLPSPTKSGFSMKRNVVKSSFFQFINHTLVEEFYKSNHVKTWHDYVLIACDGSRLALPNVEELGDRYGWYHTYQGEKLYPSAKACIFQDTLNNITVYATMEPKDKDERYTFEQHYQEAVDMTGHKAIMLLDRGYFSYLTIYRMLESGIKFVMKARTLPWQKAFIKSGRKEQIIKIKPTRTTSIYGYRKWRMNPEKELSIRLVRFSHPDGTVDVLITNLTSDEGIAASDVRELYRLRWPAETAYGIYKNQEALELFSSFRIDGVQQDFHAAVIMFNLASFLAMDCVRNNNTDVKPDMNVIIGLIHNLCPVLALGLGSRKLKRRLGFIVHDATRYLAPIRLGRTFPRIRRKRKTSGKFFRHTNFSIAI